MSKGIKTRARELIRNNRLEEAAEILLQYNAEKIKISNPNDIVAVLKQYSACRQEKFILMTLDSAHQVINKHIISVGTAGKTIVHPRDVLYKAVIDNAAACIVAHNHPSGNVQPSEEDHGITKRLLEAFNIMGIQLLDHIVIGKGSHYSFLDHGFMG